MSAAVAIAMIAGAVFAVFVALSWLLADGEPARRRSRRSVTLEHWRAMAIASSAELRRATAVMQG